MNQIRRFLEIKKQVAVIGADSITDDQALEICSNVLNEKTERLFVQKDGGFICTDDIESESEILAVYEGYIRGAIELFAGPVIKNYQEGGFYPKPKRSNQG